jgi:hypothetical protein
VVLLLAALAHLGEETPVRAGVMQTDLGSKLIMGASLKTTPVPLVVQFASHGSMVDQKLSVGRSLHGMFTISQALELML